MDAHDALPMPEPDPDLDETLLLRFEPGCKRLAPSACVRLRQWLQLQLRRDPQAGVLMACGGTLPLPARVERLRGLRQLLAHCGLPDRRVRYTREALPGAEPAHRRRREAPLPVCLRVLPARQLEGLRPPLDRLFQGVA